MNLAEIKNTGDALSSEELAELAALIRDRDNAAWDRQIDADFQKTAGCAKSPIKVRADMRLAGSGTCRDRQGASAPLEAF